MHGNPAHAHVLNQYNLMRPFHNCPVFQMAQRIYEFSRRRATIECHFVAFQKKQKLEKRRRMQHDAYASLDSDDPPPPVQRPAAKARPTAAPVQTRGPVKVPSRLPPPQAQPPGNAKQTGRTMLMMKFPEVCLLTIAACWLRKPVLCLQDKYSLIMTQAPNVTRQNVHCTMLLSPGL